MLSPLEVACLYWKIVSPLIFPQASKGPRSSTPCNKQFHWNSGTVEHVAVPNESSPCLPSQRSSSRHTTGTCCPSAIEKTDATIEAIWTQVMSSPVQGPLGTPAWRASDSVEVPLCTQTGVPHCSARRKKEWWFFCSFTAEETLQPMLHSNFTAEKT